MTRACSRCLLEDRLQSPHTCGRPDATVSPEEHRRVQAEAAAMRHILDGLACEMEGAVRHHKRPRTGMQVPFHGDFAGVSPGVIGRLRWWAREMRQALSSSAGSALLEEMEGLRRERDEMRARLAEIQRLPEADWASVTSTIAQLAASVARSGGRDVSVQMVAALDRGKVYVARRLAESADLRARLERAEERAKFGWERAAEKDRAYGEALRERDEAVAQERRAILRSVEQLAESPTYRNEPSGACEDVIDLLRARMISAEPPSSHAAEIRRAVEAETGRIATILRARASGWGADTAVGHALEVAAADIRSRGGA